MLCKSRGTDCHIKKGEQSHPPLEEKFQQKGEQVGQRDVPKGFPSKGDKAQP